MTRKLTILGLAFATMLALAALATSPAGAVEEETKPADFTAALGSEETATIDGEQLGTNTITIGSFPSLTCSSIKYNGEAVSEGPAFEQIRISPVYEACHVNVAFLGTRTATVTMNGCSLGIEATATVTESEERHLLGGTDIECPEGKKIEVHIYNTSNSSDEGASTLCKFDIESQFNLPGITLTNDTNTPTTVDDIVADFNITSISVVKTTGTESVCGKEKQTAVYKGEVTLKTTNEKAETVESSMQSTKRFQFGLAKPVLIGEGGSAELTTEKLKIKCTSKYEATPGAQQVKELTIKPTYTGCKAEPGNLDTDWDFQGCEYKQKLSPTFEVTAPKDIHTPGPMEIICGGGKPIQITVTETGKVLKCTITLSAQAPAKSIVDMKNFFPKLALEWYDRFFNTVKGLSYEPKGNATDCGQNKVLSDGELHGSLDFKAYTDAKKTKQESMEIRGS